MYAELQAMGGLFYGLYLISCEDIGLKPALAADEGVDRAQCSIAAAEWLSHVAACAVS